MYLQPYVQAIHRPSHQEKRRHKLSMHHIITYLHTRVLNVQKEWVYCHISQASVPPGSSMIMAVAADPRQSCLPPSLFPLPKVMYIIKIPREDLPSTKGPNWLFSLLDWTRSGYSRHYSAEVECASMSLRLWRDRHLRIDVG
jgi:hypothetical protein